MNCKQCQGKIASERLEALPETDVCTKCAQDRDAGRPMPKGFMVATASKGTAMTLIQIDPENPEAYRLAKRAHLRSR